MVQLIRTPLTSLLFYHSHFFPILAHFSFLAPLTSPLLSALPPGTFAPKGSMIKALMMHAGTPMNRYMGFSPIGQVKLHVSTLAIKYHLKSSYIVLYIALLLSFSVITFSPFLFLGISSFWQSYSACFIIVSLSISLSLSFARYFPLS